MVPPDGKRYNDIFHNGRCHYVSDCVLCTDSNAIHSQNYRVQHCLEVMTESIVTIQLTIYCSDSSVKMVVKGSFSDLNFLYPSGSWYRGLLSVRQHPSPSYLELAVQLVFVLLSIVPLSPYDILPDD